MDAHIVGIQPKEEFSCQASIKGASTKNGISRMSLGKRKIFRDHANKTEEKSRAFESNQGNDFPFKETEKSKLVCSVFHNLSDKEDTTVSTAINGNMSHSVNASSKDKGLYIDKKRTRVEENSPMKRKHRKIRKDKENGSHAVLSSLDFSDPKDSTCLNDTNFTNIDNGFLTLREDRNAALNRSYTCKENQNADLCKNDLENDDIFNDSFCSGLDLGTDDLQPEVTKPREDGVQKQKIPTYVCAGSASDMDAAEDNKGTSSTNGCLKSLLVLEITRGQYDNADGQSRPEKRLRLFDEETSTEKFCYLRGEWEMFEANPGDVVCVKDLEDTKCANCVIDNNSDNYVTLYPDTLISGTTISASISCPRQAILGEYFKTDFQNEAMLIGSISHDLFDWAIENKDFSPLSLTRETKKLLSETKYLEALYACGISESFALAKIMEFYSLLEDWGVSFMSAKDTKNNFEFKTGSETHAAQESSVKLSIEKARDIEENIWCPSVGIKGKVDVTAEVTVHRRPKKFTADDKLQKEEKYMLPLELKTGKMFSKLGTVEHRAQVILYTLLLSEKYDVPVDAGLLYYMKTNHMQSVPAPLREKRALLLKRNMLVRYLASAGTKFQMPGLLRDKHRCKRCPHLKNCMTYYKCVEGGTALFSGIDDSFDEITGHISKTETEYFSKWFYLILSERAEEQKSNGKGDIWKFTSMQREKEGKCLSSLRLSERKEGDSCRSKALYEFKRFPNTPVTSTPLNSCSLSVGDTVIISQEHIRTYALGSGSITTILEDRVLVETYRKIQFPSDYAGVSYRLDRDSSYTSSIVALSNLASLFSSSVERDVKLRRLILGMESPSFGRDIIDAVNQASKINGPLKEQFHDKFSINQEGAQKIKEILSSLNTDQGRAIRKALSASDYLMILGMPGTGKTTTIAHLVQILVLLGKSVLLASYTNSAVDNILCKLIEMKVDLLRLGPLNKIHHKVKGYSSQELSTAFTTVEELQNLYEAKPVVGTTCLGVKHPLFAKRRFDFCIVDEASQVTQPICIGPLRFADTFVLVGDHYQLPPLVQSVEARMDGMDESLFKALSEHHPDAIVTLEHQYRMNTKIMHLANTITYGHRMVCGSKQIANGMLNLPRLSQVSKKLLNDFVVDVIRPEHPVVFVNTDALPCLETYSKSHVCNEDEALLVYRILLGLTRAGLPTADIGIMSPYRLQLKVIRDIIKRKGDINCPGDLEIDTVDKFQGRDKSCVVFSLVRSNDKAYVGELLKDWKRVNVAITRAKEKLIFVGSMSTMKGGFVMRNLIEHLKRHAFLVSPPSISS